MTSGRVVIKKDGTKEPFNIQKVIVAVNKSAYRAMTPFTQEEIDKLCEIVCGLVDTIEGDVTVPQMHNIVEKALEEVKPSVAKSYRDYRNYKQDFVKMIDDVYKKVQSIMYIGDKSNANTDSTLVSTKRSLIYNEFNKELYQKFFMTTAELQACRDGYIYVHDMVSRRDSINCCLFDIENILNGGWEMGNQWYNEPKTLDVAFDVIADITFCAASQQYGGFTLPQIEKVLAKYAEKSYNMYYDEAYKLYMDEVEYLNSKNVLLPLEDSLNLFERYKKKAREYALKKVQRDFEQGFQGWECKFNTVSSSRGDYPFITITFGTGTSLFEKMAIFTALKVRQEGQGKPGFKKPVLFPKLVFLYDENLHGPGKEHEDLFDAAIECVTKTMYPHMLSLTGDDALVSHMYKKYGKVISPMGCRAFLSPYWERGGFKPADENDVPRFIGRFNMGAISLNLPMILAKSREENRDFYEVLDEYLELIRNLHKRTYDYIGEFKASTNPLGFCQGGFYGGYLKPNEKIRPLLKYATMSFGITALNELQVLYNGKSLVQDGEFALEVMRYINKKLDEFKAEDGILYAIYATPAESLCGTQVQQFRKKYGIIKGVSDKEYFSNSFHCHVTENISPIEKQDYEKRFWDLHKGGRVQFFRFSKKYNKEALKNIFRRGMAMGFYEGGVCPLAYCEDCGAEVDSTTECTECGSPNLTILDIVCGYLGYRKIKGDTRFNDAKLTEVQERVCM